MESGLLSFQWPFYPWHSLFLNMRKATKLHLIPKSRRKDRNLVGEAKILWYELDIMGLVLLSAAISLILIPMTLAASAKHGWHNASIIAMVVVGCVCFVVFPFWETSSKVAPQPFLSPRLFANRTVLAGCTIGFFYFGKRLYLFYLYFLSHLRPHDCGCIDVFSIQPSFIPPSTHISSPIFTWSKTTPPLPPAISLKRSASPPPSPQSSSPSSSNTPVIINTTSPLAQQSIFLASAS